MINRYRSILQSVDYRTIIADQYRSITVSNRKPITVSNRYRPINDDESKMCDESPQFYLIKSPAGTLKLAACTEGVHSMRFHTKTTNLDFNTKISIEKYELGKDDVEKTDGQEGDDDLPSDLEESNLNTTIDLANDSEQEGEDRIEIPDDPKTADAKLENFDPNSPMAIVCEWLRTYFQHPDRLAEARRPRFCFLPDDKEEGGESTTDLRFHTRVLLELSKIEFGQIVTYGELALRCGNKGASRAVGSAMRKNPSCLLIPCHRVVLKSGAIGEFAGGTRNELKKALVEYERKMMMDERMDQDE